MDARFDGIRREADSSGAKQQGWRNIALGFPLLLFVSVPSEAIVRFAMPLLPVWDTWFPQRFLSPIRMSSRFPIRTIFSWAGRPRSIPKAYSQGLLFASPYEAGSRCFAPSDSEDLRLTDPCFESRVVHRSMSKAPQTKGSRNGCNETSDGPSFPIRAGFRWYPNGSDPLSFSTRTRYDPSETRRRRNASLFHDTIQGAATHSSERRPPWQAIGSNQDDDPKVGAFLTYKVARQQRTSSISGMTGRREDPLALLESSQEPRKTIQGIPNVASKGHPVQEN